MSSKAGRKVFGFSLPAGVVNNLFSVYGIYCSTYLLALVTVPYLSRTLGPAAWGLLAAVQSFGGCILVAVEFGFTFSGIKDATRATGDPGSLREVLSSVQGAKFVLLLLGCGVSLIVQRSMPLFRDNPAAFWCGVAWAVIQGSNLMWFFQSIERMRLMATIDFLIRIVAVIATFVFVHGPADTWRALAFQAGASLLSLAASIHLASKIAGFEIPRWSGVRRALASSVKTFIPRNASILYTLGNTFMLGFFARPEIVGFYAGADRVCRALTGLLAPASEAIYPRISHVATQSRDRTVYLARVGAAIMTAAGFAMTAFMYFLAPLLVRILLGPGYEAAITPLRILSLLPPVIALRNVLTIHWMLPLDLEKEINTVVLASGVLNIILAILIAPRYGAVGMAWVVVISQVAASLGAWLVLRWIHLDPFGNSGHSSGSSGRVDCGVQYGVETVVK